MIGPAIDGLLATIAAAVIPAVGMRYTVVWLGRHAPRVRNYRGVYVPVGLGIVWLWALTGLAALAAVRLVRPFWEEGGHTVLSSWFALALLVVLAVGTLDDVVGGSRDRGLRGHLRAAAQGRLTTGLAKLVLIGVVAALSAMLIADIPPFGARAIDATAVSTCVAATILIAGSANLVNLLDLRPGRALKGYLALASLAIVAVAVWSDPSDATYTWGSRAVLAAALFGPVLAVWRLDLGERAMLGDGGANALGFAAAYWLASVMPLGALLLGAGAAAVLNLLSERVSFTAVIERVAFLRWLDGLGRLAVDDRESRSAHSDETPKEPDER